MDGGARAYVRDQIRCQIGMRWDPRTAASRWSGRIFAGRWIRRNMGSLQTPPLALLSILALGLQTLHSPRLLQPRYVSVRAPWVNTAGAGSGSRLPIATLLTARFCFYVVPLSINSCASAGSRRTKNQWAPDIRHRQAKLPIGIVVRPVHRQGGDQQQ